MNRMKTTGMGAIAMSLVAGSALGLPECPEKEKQALRGSFGALVAWAPGPEGESMADVLDGKSFGDLQPEAPGAAEPQSKERDELDRLRERLRRLDEQVKQLDKRLRKGEGADAGARRERYTGVNGMGAFPVATTYSTKNLAKWTDWARPGSEQPEVIELKKTDEGSSYNVIIQKQDGDNSISVEIKDGKATARVNGEKVPEDRVKMDGGKVTVFDEAGNEIAAFPMIVSPGFAGAWTTDAPRGLGWVQGQNAFRNFNFEEDDFTFATQDPPPVMLGITMASPGESVAEHFDLDEGEGIEIQSVIEGLPAAEAGLRAKDIIVKVEGADETTPDGLRTVLRKKQPGDEIKIKVLRQGDVQERVLKLRKYDAKKLGGTFQLELGAEPFWTGSGELPSGVQFPRRFWGEFEKSLKGHLDEPEIGEAKRALEEAMKHLRAAPGFAQRLRVAPEVGRWLYLQGEDDGNREFFAVPRSRGGGGSGGPVGRGDLEEQIASLKEELAEVRGQRDVVAGELREIKELLKKLAGDRQ